ncbi:MAG TPA: sarcosine oxidase subunit gamma family protein [Steroidobacteraceae bacterium]|nr:sarcosine oxidase subunit gamma family protein [Steroidobacteraceae bacterium]
MSAPEATPSGRASAVTLRARPADVVELAAVRDRAQVLKALARRRGIQLPDPGHVVATGSTLALCVRPERWLVMTPPESTGAAAALWQAACAGCGIGVDLSSALMSLEVAGPEMRALLARGCRLDLDPEVFPVGRAAATIMAQVPVILAAIEAGVLLLLTPTSTGRHFREWLTHAGRPFGLAPDGDASVADVSADAPT